MKRWMVVMDNNRLQQELNNFSICQVSSGLVSFLFRAPTDARYGLSFNDDIILDNMVSNVMYW
ncbi:hypothetical protein TIFTF001_040536, partial [Ficus carica]